MPRIAIVGDVHLSDSCPKSRRDVDYLGTLLGKLEYIMNRSDAVVFLGDVFKTPTMSYSSLIRIISFFRSQTIPLYSIIGNHDVPYLNSELLYKTSLGLMDVLGLIKVISEKTTIFGVSFDSIPFKRGISVPEDCDVVLGHCFLKSSLDPDNSLETCHLKELTAKYVFGGHDHSPYKPMEESDTVVYRGGPLHNSTDFEHQYLRKNAHITGFFETGLQY